MRREIWHGFLCLVLLSRWGRRTEWRRGASLPGCGGSGRETVALKLRGDYMRLSCNYVADLIDGDEEARFQSKLCIVDK